MTKMDNYLEKYKKLTLLEYINPSAGYMQSEADEEQPAPDMGSGMPPQGGDPMGGGPDMGGDPSMGGGDSQGPQGFAPQGGEDPEAGGMPMDGEPMPDAEGSDDEVIDVDELVDAQEETQEDLTKFMKKFSSAAEKLGPMVDKILKSIDATNEKVASLEKEFEKRNPTPVEKMNLRSAEAYPFNTSTKDYWDEKEATSNYSTEDDNNGANDERYKITKADIDSMNNYNAIAKELNYSAPKLTDIFGY